MLTNDPHHVCQIEFNNTVMALKGPLEASLPQEGLCKRPTWRQDHYQIPPNGGLFSAGTLNMSPAWFQQSHDMSCDHFDFPMSHRPCPMLALSRYTSTSWPFSTLHCAVFLYWPVASFASAETHLHLGPLLPCVGLHSTVISYWPVASYASADTHLHPG